MSPLGSQAALDRARRASRAESWVSALLLGSPALVPALWPRAAGWLEYDRGRIAAGELWRGVTCHWTHWPGDHWPGDHLLWDLVVFVLLVALSWRFGRARTLGALASAAFLIPLALWLLAPELERYRGLSGLDSALFVLLAAGLIRRELVTGRRRTVALLGALLLAFAAKVVLEAATGRALFVDASAAFVPVPLAHLVGGLCGAAAAASRLVVRGRPGSVP